MTEGFFSTARFWAAPSCTALFCTRWPKPLDRQDHYGAPSLSFIYEHLAYPFGLSTLGAVQMQGLGISLINNPCESQQVRIRRGEQQAIYHYAYGRLLQQTREPARVSFQAEP
ncbi:hypothetical protein WG899_00570 [Paucibacter sp. AS339]|uniref:hypothetical protein n=1 Tax=Paucibacter hankyongi TaxID=3133434 RepID=UPI003098D429